MDIRLHINIDHVATLRNARGTRYPDPVFAAQLCEQAGADGITAHLREDRRHIHDDDMLRLRAAVTTLLNMEMAATDEMVAVAVRVKPDVVTLVPERREERTTEGGLDVVGQRPAVAKAIDALVAAGIKVSLFVAADEAQLRLSRELGAQQIELHTGDYCHAPSATELERLAAGARLAHALGLEVAAGHGLTRHNVVEVAALREITELNIGHAVIGDAVFVGLPQAVRDLRDAVRRGIERRG
ncbi:MAG: pyridoxine 5'-phosphate synthase [Deltaproteobacteria bacterium]|nr:pyridoxine 5'-phosphate synthase [Deltaproteobacteria bacterium]